MSKDLSTPGFLFVNKTSSSDVLTRSNRAEERFTILSHVQNRRRKKGKEEKAAEPWTRYASYMTPTSGEESITSVEVELERRKRDDNRPPSIPQHTRSSPRLPQTYPANNGADPFHCTIVGPDACAHAMLNFAFSRVAKKTFLAEAFALPTVHPNTRAMRHAHIMEERLRRCVEDEMLMYSTLAYGSSCLAWSVGRYEDNKPPEYFIGKALQAVRMRLSMTSPNKPLDVWLLLSIYALTITEFWGATPELWTKCPTRYISVLNSDKKSGLNASRTHMSALLRVVENAGGWKNVDPYVLESSILADKYLAISEMTTPVIPLTWDPGRMPRARQDEFQIHPDSILPRLGEELLQLPMCQKLAEVIRDVMDFAKMAHGAWSCVHMLTSLDENWLFLRHQALVYRLLLLGDNLQNLENCVRITTLLFLLNATEYHGSRVSARVTLERLISTLIHAGLFEEELGDGFLFWCLCSGAMTTEPSHERDWFQGILARFFMLPGSSWTEQVFQEHLEPYLFLAVKQEAQLASLIDTLRGREHILLDQSA